MKSIFAVLLLAGCTAREVPNLGELAKVGDCFLDGGRFYKVTEVDTDIKCVDHRGVNYIVEGTTIYSKVDCADTFDKLRSK